MCIFTTPASIIYFLINDMPSLFVRLVRRLRRFLAEFLEARIIPERIEHRIEPEQRGGERRKLSEKVSLYCFSANEVTIFSKRGSPRSGSQKGSSLGRRNSARPPRREHGVPFPVAAMLTPSRLPTPR